SRSRRGSSDTGTTPAQSPHTTAATGRVYSAAGSLTTPRMVPAAPGLVAQVVRRGKASLPGADRAERRVGVASIEERKAICRWGYQELWNMGNLDVIAEAVAEDVLVHDVVNGELRGRDQIRDVVTAYRAAFSDLHLTIEDQIAEGDTVVTRWSATGT